MLELADPTSNEYPNLDGKVTLAIPDAGAMQLLWTVV